MNDSRQDKKVWAMDWQTGQVKWGRPQKTWTNELVTRSNSSEKGRDIVRGNENGKR